MHNFFLSAAPLILFFPLIGAATIAVLGPYVHRSASAFVGNLSIFLSFVLTAGLASIILPMSPMA